MVRIAKPCSHHSDAEIVLIVVSSDDQKKLNVDADLGLRAATPPASSTRFFVANQPSRFAAHNL